MYSYHRNIELLNETPEEIPVSEAKMKHYLKAIVHNAIKENTGLLGIQESFGFLKNYGISQVKTSVVQNVNEALKAAASIGYPIVLKTAKTTGLEKDNIIQNIDSDDGMKRAYTKLIEAFRASHPGSEPPGLIVQKMLDRIDHEWLLQSKKDAEFGSTIFFGKHLKEKGMPVKFAAALPPLNRTLAKCLLEESEIEKIIKEDSEHSSDCLRRLEEMIVGFSNIIIDFPEIAKMELGPLAIVDDNAYCLNIKITVDTDYTINASRYPHLVIMPYPSRYITTWVMNDGTEVTLRPIRPEDEPLVREMFSGLSEETLRVRFFVAMEINHRMLMQLCNIDYDREIAFVAETREGTKKKIIGGGRLIIEPDFKNGQFAVLIHDNYQGKGLGEKFVDMTIGVAQERGLEEIYGIVLTENEKMLRVCRKMGFKPTTLPDGITRVTLNLK